MNGRERDEHLVARFIDGMLHSEELAAFERRQLSEPTLRAMVEEQREARDWLTRDRAACDAAEPTRRSIAGAVLAEVRRLPSRAELERHEITEAAEQSVLRLSRALLVAAALVFAVSALFWSGLMQGTDPRHLEASDRQRIEAIDHAIDAAEAQRRFAELPPR
ncbi:MAG: hypothetical protein AAF628_03345 [Planctomycetota bacterium]